MEDILVFLQNNQWIYLPVGLIAIIYLRRLILTWREWRHTTFGLERESVQRSFTASLTIVVILLLIALGEFVIVTIVAPSMPRKTFTATATIDILATATVTLAPAGSGGTSEPVQTPTIAVSVGCIPGKVEWTKPEAGEVVRGKITLAGIVKVINLGFYKYEYKAAISETWTTIAADTRESFEAVWDASEEHPGDYLLRIVVSDSQNQETTSCTLPVTITAP